MTGSEAIAAAEAASDARLVEAAGGGDARAFEELVGRYYGMVFAVGLARMNDAARAEELVQEVFLRAHLSLGKLENPAFFAAWITRIARNLSTDWVRGSSDGARIARMVPLDAACREVPDERRPGVREKLQTDQEMRELQAALARLSPALREVVLLHFIEGMTQEEIGRRLGLHRTSVGRMLDRALSRMRGMLERELRDASPGMRAPTRVRTRTVAMVAAAAALGGAEKSALAAACADAVSAGAGGASASGYLALSPWQAFAALTIKGGAMMATTKGILAATVGAAAVGFAIYAKSGESGSAAAAPAPAAQQIEAAGGSLIPPPSPPKPIRTSWTELAREYLAEHPDNVGLTHLIEADSRLDAALGNQRDAMDSTVADGWSVRSASLEPLFSTYGAAMNAASAAAAAVPFDLPPQEDMATPIPNLLHAQNLARLMLTAARRVEAAGQADDALARAVHTARYGESFCGPGAPLVLHLTGLSVMNRSLGAAESILRNPRMTAQGAQAAFAALQELEKIHAPVGEAVRVELVSTVRTVRRLRDQPASASSMDRASVDLLKAAVARTADFERAQERVGVALLGELRKPHWERAALDSAFLSSIGADELRKLAPLVNVPDAAVRDTAALARMRMVQALCLLKAGRADEAQSLTDPFTGGKLRILPDRVASAGPDKTDDGGATEFSFKNGPASAGDIVAIR